MKNILYIGRFQPFHKGHADAVKQIFEKFSGEKFHLFIGIGSAENNFEEKNPLTAGERFQIINDAMKELGISPEFYSLVPIRNINHYALWPHHVQQYLPQIDVFVSGSPLVQNLWNTSFPESEIFLLTQREKISGTTLRKFLLQEGENSPYLQNFLLSSVQKNIQKFGLQQRLQKIKTAF